MTWKGSLELLLVHCQGEIGKVITAGAPDIPGTTIVEKMSRLCQVIVSGRDNVVARGPAASSRVMVFHKLKASAQAWR